MVDNKNNVVSRKLGHDTELSKVKTARSRHGIVVASQMLGDKKTLSQQES